MTNESETAAWHLVKLIPFDPPSYHICMCIDGKHGWESHEFLVTPIDDLADSNAIITDHNQARRVPELVAALEAEAAFCEAQAETPSDEGLTPLQNQMFEDIYLGIAVRLRAALIDAEVPNNVQDASEQG